MMFKAVLYLQRLRRSSGICLRIRWSTELLNFKGTPEETESWSSLQSISAGSSQHMANNKIMTQWNWLNDFLGAHVSWPPDFLSSPVFLTSPHWTPGGCSYWSQTVVFIPECIHNSHFFLTKNNCSKWAWRNKPVLKIIPLSMASEFLWWILTVRSWTQPYAWKHSFQRSTCRKKHAEVFPGDEADSPQI